MTKEELPEQPLVLPDYIAQIVPAERIQENETRLLGSAPTIDEAILAPIRDTLGKLYLIHATDKEGNFVNGVVPYSQNTHPNAQHVGNTFQFDKSLGLNRCVFFSWPRQPDNHDWFGDYKLLVTSRLITSDRCFVTPDDILSSAPPDEDEEGRKLSVTEQEQEVLYAVHDILFDGTYQELTDGNTFALKNYFDLNATEEEVRAIKQRTIRQLDNNYFNKLVSGKAWLEYTARILASGGTDKMPLGEIKYYGAIDRSMIEARVDRVEYEETYLPYIERVLEIPRS